MPHIKSIDCFAVSNRSTIGAGAATHAMRKPGASVFENVLK
jgi:hypothetical protein